MASRDFGGGRGWQDREDDRDYYRNDYRGMERDDERGWRDRTARQWAEGRDDRDYGGRDYGDTRSLGDSRGYNDSHNERNYDDRDWRNRDWQDRSWQSRQWQSRRDQRLDLGDRNPSQGFTGGYGGAFGSSYAQAGDRIDERGGDYDRGGYGGTMRRDWNDDATRRSYAGRGPRNYQRSDQRIEEDVNEALMRHHDVDASDVQVRVQNAEVTLSGEVEDRRAKRLAEDIAERVMGVRDVHNELKARRGFWDTLFGGSDADADRDRERNREQNRQLNERAASAERGTTAASSTTSGTSGGATRTRNGTSDTVTSGSRG